ncbi:peptide deformylase [Acetobacter orleanensis]|uniref:Peptide deformylase n=1 Tax=Acetobacter orleanensis TaxID=104099 RepID=A0A4Y3TMF5_9PROT|nr:peptide deformylase [Acetobacter orleanensis]KXV64278.1 peptide deformylase [Acetobacter orleanensis]PCD79060.1 peptide deformylase [Acetobacter orleanensis]GAN69418.1 peptide deformylase [Acetobacter orleanensis JCM 7639]GBR22475.1 peptide deformylase [Acetobacter orleanensis NRIC 0473]GEB82978.1 peptide deformylase [Acetobacter orleanensis]
MAVLKVARMGHPVLLGRAEEVEEITAPDTQRVIQDMIETLKDAGGVGLAAPQVHVSKRIFLYCVPESRSEGEEDPPCAVQVLINPVLEPVGEEQVPRLEGCLSIPGLRGEVPRYRRVRYAGYDEMGQRVEGVASGFRANVMQHEMDHLDGILYPMRMDDLGKLGFDAEITRYGVRT